MLICLDVYTTNVYTMFHISSFISKIKYKVRLELLPIRHSIKLTEDIYDDLNEIINNFDDETLILFSIQ